MIRIEYKEQVIEIEGDPTSPIVVTVQDALPGEIILLQGDTKKYILRVTKEKKLVLN